MQAATDRTPFPVVHVTPVNVDWQKVRENALAAFRAVRAKRILKPIKDPRPYTRIGTGTFLGKKFLFEDNKTELTTTNPTLWAAHAMATQAKAKGWKVVTLNGSKKFKRHAWLYIHLAGLRVEGYQPSPAEIQRLATLRSLQNTMAPVQAGPAKAEPAPAQANPVEPRRGSQAGQQGPKQHESNQPEQTPKDPEPKSEPKQETPKATGTPPFKRRKEPFFDRSQAGLDLGVYDYDQLERMSTAIGALRQWAEKRVQAPRTPGLVAKDGRTLFHATKLYLQVVLDNLVRLPPEVELRFGAYLKQRHPELATLLDRVQRARTYRLTRGGDRQLADYLTRRAPEFVTALTRAATFYGRNGVEKDADLAALIPAPLAREARELLRRVAADPAAAEVLRDLAFQKLPEAVQREMIRKRGPLAPPKEPPKSAIPTLPYPVTPQKDPVPQPGPSISR